MKAFEPCTLFVGFLILVHATFPTTLRAQESTNIAEPPIPVYYYANQEDSGKTGSTSLAAAALTKRIDSLETTLKITALKHSSHFAWLYTLIALSVVMNILLFYSTIRIRKELAQVKRFEHQQKFEKVEHEILASQPLPLQQPMFKEKVIKREPLHHLKTRTKKTK
jgi:hypothetical protein